MIYKRTIQILDNNGEWKTTDYGENEWGNTYAEVWKHNIEDTDTPTFDDEGRLLKLVSQSVKNHRTIREFIYG
jgi:hypothetical protein